MSPVSTMAEASGFGNFSTASLKRRSGAMVSWSTRKEGQNAGVKGATSEKNV